MPEEENKDPNKIEKHEELKKRENLTHKLRENPFILSTVVCGVFALFLLVVVISRGGIAGNVVSADVAGENLVEFLNQVADSEVTLVDVENFGDFYKVTVEFKDSEIPVYVTKDGKYYTSTLASLSLYEEEEESQDIPKSDRPVAELYIWSYCPYGVTALEPFAEVALLLEDYADFKVFLYYAGHGDFEVQQNKIQACIQELGYDYWDYAETFVNDIYEKCYGDADCDLSESVALMDSLGIDSDKVLACVESDGSALLEEHYNAAEDAEVTGSPTLMINGVKVSASRTAEAYKNAVCSAFTDENVPEVCNEELDSTGTTASGSC